MHIAISGNIGSGKTVLAERLSRHFGWVAELEEIDKNPYLADFYEDMQRWSFPLQVYFLNSRYKQIKRIKQLVEDQTVVQDRTIYEDAYIFATNLKNSGHMSERDYHTYLNIFHSMIGDIEPPDLLVYLRSGVPNLVKRIQQRGREFEYLMQIAYLQDLNRHYENWISQYDLGQLLIVDVDEIDFMQNEDHFDCVKHKIENALK